MGPEELEGDGQFESELDDDGQGLQDDGGTQDDEPFLKVNDRTVYKDRDSALKGFEEKDRYISEYARFGKPHEIQQRLAQLEALEKMGFQPGGAKKGDDADDILADIDNPEMRKQWEWVFGKVEKAIERRLKQGGYVSQEKLPEYLNSFQSEQQAFSSVREKVSESLSKMGLNVSDQGKQAIEHQLIQIARDERNPMSRTVNKLWDDRDYEGLAKIAIEYFGFNVERKDTDGAAAEEAKRLQHAATKEKTRRLPNGPPRTRGTSAEGDSDEARRQRLATREGRREEARLLARAHRGR